MYSKIKKLGSDTLIYGFATIFGRFLSFLLTPMYTNMLHTSQFEFVIYLYTLIGCVTVVFSFGMESSFFRFYTREHSDQPRKVFTHAFYVINLISFAFTLLILFSSDSIAAMIANPEVRNASYLIKLAAFIPLFDTLILIPMGFLRITEQAKKFAAVRFAMIILTVILNFIFLMGFNLQAQGVILAQLIVSLIGLFYFIPLIFRNFINVLDINLLIRMLKFGFPTMPANLAAIILQIGDRPILSEITKSSLQVATYQANYRLGIPMMIFVTIFEYAWKPFYLSNHQEENAKVLYSRIFTYFTLICALIFLTVSLFIPYVIKLPGIGGKYFINPEYWEGIGIIPIVLAAYFFNGVFTNISAGFLITKETKYLPLVVGFAAIVNIAANFLLIPYFGYFGAAWATFIAYFLSAILIYRISLKIYPVNYEWKKVGTIALTTLVIFVLDKISMSLFDGSVEFFIKILLTAIFLYSLKYFNFFDKDETVIIKRLFKRSKN
ncbi:MAG: polysaccharide biosynthesis C-terminal domain-containing protein [Candidatus Kapabacteria bacterium]|nr:polysaccharide biosynthesis C-terminal domain-containing protein [Candidatus Kapabacteria bacterium]